MGAPALEIKDVSSGILENVNIEVENGAFVVIIAPSGSGKSTLLNLICRIGHPASGKIMINGVDIYSISDFNKWRAANIGYIYEQDNLIPSLTVYENIELPMFTTKIDKEKRRARVLNALESVGLKDKERLFPKKLSMEDKQRTAIARAIAIEPAIILADEPTGKLKKEQTQSIIGLMGELNKKTGNTFVVASHDHSLKSAATKIFELSS